MNPCKGRQFRQNLLKYRNQRVSIFVELLYANMILVIS